MAVTILDPNELLRQGLKNWWLAQASLSSLGDVYLARDDGSPVSGATDTPHVIIRFGDAVLDRTSNSQRYWQADVTFEIFGNSAADVNLSCKPLDVLLAEMPGSQPSLPEGSLIELRWRRSRLIQLGANRWRADRECEADVVVSRTPD